MVHSRRPGVLLAQALAREGTNHFIQCSAVQDSLQETPAALRPAALSVPTPSIPLTPMPKLDEVLYTSQPLRASTRVPSCFTLFRRDLPAFGLDALAQIPPNTLVSVHDALKVLHPHDRRERAYLSTAKSRALRCWGYTDLPTGVRNSGEIVTSQHAVCPGCRSFRQPTDSQWPKLLLSAHHRGTVPQFDSRTPCHSLK